VFASGTFGNSTTASANQITTPAPASPAFTVNGSPITGSVSYSYSMLTSGLYAFNFTGSQWATVRLRLYGAGGGHALYGGTGGYVEGVITLSSIGSRQFWVVVGGGGGASLLTSNAPLYTLGGYNGGGRGVTNSSTPGYTGGGGGATDVRLVYTSVTDYASAQRVLVAGGGGGGTSNGSADAIGGAAGYPSAPNVANVSYGGADGGTQSAGGALNGGFGTGGENANNTGWNGGGGGGWYGGGACKVQHGAGAGGSNYYNASYISSFSYTSSGGGSGAQSSGQAILTIMS